MPQLLLLPLLVSATIMVAVAEDANTDGTGAVIVSLCYILYLIETIDVCRTYNCIALVGKVCDQEVGVHMKEEVGVGVKDRVET
jgi:hypothetical protein